MLASSPPASAQEGAPQASLLKGSSSSHAATAASLISDFKVSAELTSTMHSLANSFEDWRLQKQNQIISEKQQYAARLAQHAESVASLKSQYATLAQSKSHMLASLEGERQELEELTASIHELESSKAKLLIHKKKKKKKCHELSAKLKRERESKSSVLCRLGAG